MKIVDTNVLLFVINTRAAEHTRVREWWDLTLAGPEQIGLTWIAMLGFVRISTNRKSYTQPLSPEQALDKITRWLSHPNIRIVQETTQHATLLADLIRQIGTAGNLTTDAHLAALAIGCQATMVSTDKDFSRFKQLKWENPLAVP